MGAKRGSPLPLLQVHGGGMSPCPHRGFSCSACGYASDGARHLPLGPCRIRAEPASLLQGVTTPSQPNSVSEVGTGREGPSFSLGRVGDNLSSSPERSHRWVLAQYLPSWHFPARPFFLRLLMVFLWAPWVAHHAALYPQCPPSAVPDPTILPLTWISPLLFGHGGRQEQVPSVTLAAPQVSLQTGGTWSVPGFLMDP